MENHTEKEKVTEQAFVAGFEKLRASSQFTDIMGFAKGLVKSNGHQELDLVHIALGAWLAKKNGVLNESVVIQHHLEQYQPELERFLDLTRWSNEGVTPSTDALDVSGALEQAVAKCGDSGDPILALLNFALRAVNDVVGADRVAIHEAAHAVVSLALRPEVRIAEITIKPSNDAGGYVRWDETNPYYETPTSREDVIEDLCVALAGRAAQVRKFGADAADAGAQSDMHQATRKAFQAVAMIGLDEDFGPVFLPAIGEMMGKIAGLGDKPLVQGFLFDEAQRRTQVLLKEAYARTIDLVNQNWSSIEQVAGLLIEKKTVTEEELRKALPALNV